VDTVVGKGLADQGTLRMAMKEEKMRLPARFRESSSNMSLDSTGVSRNHKQ
jgi:hypothetical protein